MNPTLRQQTALLVRTREGRTRLAVWTQWQARGRLRTEIVVWRVVRTLLPRDQIAHHIEKRALDVDYRDLEAWFQAHDFELLGRMDGPSIEEPLSS
ncbi:MAG: hypothetical protein H6721_06995 [Sandaracinus sp.]|nr:hypothetical protein [Sandaracinus sp.]MCB9622985.1 hypothetical protein [Sandaracinus sp.]MCB9631866.1 hypothetical protein [Sandaracinus sp.]